MVQIYSLTVLKQSDAESKPQVLANHIEGQSWYSWFYSDTVTQFVSFFSKFLCERTETSSRQQVTQDSFVGYVHKRSDGLTVVCVTDLDYPDRVACDLIRKVLYEFSDFAKSNCIDLTRRNLPENCASAYNENLKDLVTKFQDPAQADKMIKLRKDVERTTETLKLTLQKLLKRGETIEKIIEDTDELNESAKEYYKRARRAKCACNIL